MPRHGTLSKNGANHHLQTGICPILVKTPNMDGKGKAWKELQGICEQGLLIYHMALALLMIII